MLGRIYTEPLRSVRTVRQSPSKALVKPSHLVNKGIFINEPRRPLILGEYRPEVLTESTKNDQRPITVVFKSSSGEITKNTHTQKGRSRGDIYYTTVNV